MRCDNCGQRSDWVGEDSGWSPLEDGEVVALGFVECDRCGHHQRVK